MSVSDDERESQRSTNFTSTSHRAWTRFTHPLIQTWPLCWARAIFGQRSLEVIRWCEFECDGGSGQTLLRRSRCCLPRAGRRAKPAGRAEVPMIGPACPRWRWRGGEKFHRSTDGQENLTANCWWPQKPSLSRADCLWGRAQSPDRLRLQSTSVRANRRDCRDTVRHSLSSLCRLKLQHQHQRCFWSHSVWFIIERTDSKTKQTLFFCLAFSHSVLLFCWNDTFGENGWFTDELQYKNSPKQTFVCFLSKFTFVEWKETTELNHNSVAALGQCKASSNLTWWKKKAQETDYLKIKYSELIILSFIFFY